MTYTLGVSDFASDEPDPTLHDLAKSIASITEAVADKYGAPDIHVDLIFATDFVGATQDALDRTRTEGEDTQPFDTERLGGVAVAKNVPLSEDCSHVAVVMNRDLLTAEGDLAAHSIFLIAHELFHPVLNRLRHQSGVLVDVVYPSHTPSEVARSISRIIADEYRADFFASAMLGHFGSAFDANGEQVSLHAGHIFGDSYVEQFTDVLDSHIWPGWPDLVMDYRTGRLELDEMWSRILSQTEQTLTLLAHAQAVGDAAKGSGPLDGGNAEHPGVTGYLQPVWTTFMEALKDDSLIPHGDTFGATDIAIADALEQALIAMWARLGLTFTVGDDRDFFIHVTNPQR